LKKDNAGLENNVKFFKISTNETCQDMVIALQHLETYANKVKGVVEMSETRV